VFREFVSAQGLAGFAPAALVLLFLVFVAVVVHALTGRGATARLERLARLPLDDGNAPGGPEAGSEGRASR